MQGLKKLFHYEWRPSIVWRRITKSLGSRQFALFQAAVVHPPTLPGAADLRQKRLNQASKEDVGRNCGKLWEGTVGNNHANVHAWLEHTKSNSSVIYSLQLLPLDWHCSGAVAWPQHLWTQTGCTKYIRKTSGQQQKGEDQPKRKSIIWETTEHND